MNRSRFTKLITILLFAAVVGYFGMQAYRYLVNPHTSVPVYADESEDTLTLRGYLVRDEEVLPGGAPLVELSCAEGARVAAGGTVATIFRTQESYQKTRRLEERSARLARMEQARDAIVDAKTTLTMDDDVLSSLLSFRSAIAKGDLPAAEGTAERLKGAVLKREYSYGNSAELTVRIAALKEEVAALSKEVGTVQTVKAPFAGTYSAVADGYEAVLTPERVAAMTPSELESVKSEPVGENVGKLIRGTAWYYAAILREEEAKLLTVGKTYTLRPASGTTGELRAAVKSVSRSEDGRVVVLFSGSQGLSDVTLLRETRMELVLQKYSGLRVPKNALRIDENGQIGVYCEVGLIAYFKPVRVLCRSEDSCLVEPVRIESTSESKVQLYTLRVNDSVIVSADELYDGKVVG